MWKEKTNSRDLRESRFLDLEYSWSSSLSCQHLRWNLETNKQGKKKDCPHSSTLRIVLCFVTVVYPNSWRWTHLQGIMFLSDSFDWQNPLISSFTHWYHRLLIKDVCANCFCASLLCMQVHSPRHASSVRAKY